MGLVTNAALTSGKAPRRISRHASLKWVWNFLIRRPLLPTKVEVSMDLDTAKEQERLAEPLTGDDAARFVAYIENPTVPAGHNEYLQAADEAHTEIQPRPDTQQ
jgi:hypothetical protein